MANLNTLNLSTWRALQRDMKNWCKKLKKETSKHVRGTQIRLIVEDKERKGKGRGRRCEEPGHVWGFYTICEEKSLKGFESTKKVTLLLLQKKRLETEFPVRHHMLQSLAR
jgi:hypothetical protein